MRTIRWGIMGTGTIAHTFASDLQLVEGHVIQGVASRKLETAQNFADTFAIPNVYDTYEGLAKDASVDVIYIASPHVFHKAHAMMCIMAGKGVLCEKPMGINLEEVQTVIQAAKDQNVFFMEAMWTRFKPTIQKVKGWLAAGAIGPVRMVTSDFGFSLPEDTHPDHRLLNKSLGGGALLDVGVYPLAMIQMILGNSPKTIKGQHIIGPTDVDLTTMGSFIYSDKSCANFVVSIGAKTPWETRIIGDLGQIIVPDTWFGHSVILETKGHKQVFEFEPFGKNYTYEIMAVGEALSQGLTEHPDMTHADSLAVMQLVTAVRTDANGGLTENE